MTQRIKLLLLAFSTLALTYCQDAPSGHRMFGMTAAPLTQTSDAFTGVPQKGGLLPNEMLQAIINSRKQASSTPPEPSEPGIDYANKTDTRAACLGKGTVDTDHDGLPDDCDKEHFPNAYNGWIFGGRYFDPDSTELELTTDEDLRWSEISKAYGGINLSRMSPTSQKIFKKMEAFRNAPVHSDLQPSQYAYYNLGGIPIRISDLFKASIRSGGMFQENEYDDKNLGLAAGDGTEVPFYSRENPAISAYGITGFGKDIYSLLERKPKIIAWETNVILPADATHLQMAMADAYDVSTGCKIKPTSALYSVINNNDTILLKSKLLSNRSNKLIGQDYGTLSKNPGCITANLQIIAHVDSKGIITPEIPVFRKSEKDQWTTYSQENFSIVPLGEADCQRSFIDNTGKNNKSFFYNKNNVTSRVPGVVDFNSSLSFDRDLNQTGTINPRLLVDGNTQSLDFIREGLESKPISEMTEHELDEFNKSLIQVNSALKDEKVKAAEEKWIKDTKEEIKKRRLVLAGKSGTEPPVVTDVDPKLLQFDSDGCVALASEDIVALKSLGFTFNDANVTTGNIAIGTLEAILEVLKAKIESGSLTPDESAAILKFLESMKKQDCAKDLIKQFLIDHADKLCPNGWTDAQIEYLNSLDKPESKVQPGLVDLMKTIPDCFDNPTDEAKAKDEALTKIEGKLLDPSTLETYSVDERVAEAEKLNKTGFIDSERYAVLRLNIEGLRDKKYNFKYTRVEIKHGQDKDGKDIVRKVIMLEGAVIRFETGSNKIRFESQQLLQKMAGNIRSYKDDPIVGKESVYMLLRAYTDPIGKDADNTKLSQCRANAVREFFSGKINIEWCNAKGQTIGHFPVEDIAKLPDDQKFEESNIKAVGLGEDIRWGQKTNAALSEKLRRVEVYLSSEPF